MSQSDMYRGARNLGKRQKLLLMLLADDAKCVRQLAYDWPTDCEEAIRDALKRLVDRGLVDVAGWDGRSRTFKLTDRGATVQRVLSRAEEEEQLSAAGTSASSRLGSPPVRRD